MIQKGGALPRFEVVCSECRRQESSRTASFCSECRGRLEFAYDYEAVQWDERFANNMWRFWPLLPIDKPNEITTLGEGSTPLLPMNSHPDHRIFIKDEARNPTGSHKDRSLAVAINHGREIGAGASIVVSTGSAGISNAAMASRSSMASIAVMSSGIPRERIFPMEALGSAIVEVEAEVDLIVERTQEICRELGLYVSTTSRASNPYQSEGNKTIAYEIVEQLGMAPDVMVVPVGGGGTIAGVWRGFCDLKQIGKITSLPQMIGVVPADYNGLEVALEQGIKSQDDLLGLPYQDSAPSVLVKIAHPFPPDGADALRAVRAADGFFVAVSDQEAMQAAADLGRNEGLYAEPSSAACIAGLNRLIADRKFPAGATVVVMISGSGFRETFLTASRTAASSRQVGIDGLSALLAEFT